VLELQLKVNVDANCLPDSIHEAFVIIGSLGAQLRDAPHGSAAAAVLRLMRLFAHYGCTRDAVGEDLTFYLARTAGNSTSGPQALRWWLTDADASALSLHSDWRDRMHSDEPPSMQRRSKYRHNARRRSA